MSVFRDSKGCRHQRGSAAHLSTHCKVSPWRTMGCQGMPVLQPAREKFSRGASGFCLLFLFFRGVEGKLGGTS